MALRAGYYGLKKKLLEKVNALPGIKSIGDGLSLNSTTGVLSATGGGGTTVVANPEGEASANLTKLEVGETIYGIPAQPDITGKADITAIGTNETGNTASNAYAVGEHFYKNGKFCTAIAAIASGATFTLGTNYVEGTIADAVNNIYLHTAFGLTVEGNTAYDTGITFVSIKDKYRYLFVSILHEGNQVISDIYPIISGLNEFRPQYTLSRYSTSYSLGMVVYDVDNKLTVKFEESGQSFKMTSVIVMGIK